MQGTTEDFFQLQKAMHHIEAGDKALKKDNLMGTLHGWVGPLDSMEYAYIGAISRPNRKSR